MSQDDAITRAIKMTLGELQFALTVAATQLQAAQAQLALAQKPTDAAIAEKGQPE